jgi:HAD superfamily hydrolase (TIGR01490 family)
VTLALFDIDGTLLPGSTERRFWRYLFRHGQQGPAQIAAYVLFLVRRWPTFGTTVLKKNKAYLRGLPVERVRALAERFVATEVVPRLRESVLLRLREHLSAGDRVVLLSGTIEPVAAALAATLGVEHVVATACAQRDGRYTTAPPTAHPFGAAKLELARDIAAALGCDLGAAAAYGDSHHDLPLLSAVGRPVAVFPEARLAAAARERRFEVLAGASAADAATDYM